MTYSTFKNSFLLAVLHLSLFFWGDYTCNCAKVTEITAKIYHLAIIHILFNWRWKCPQHLHIWNIFSCLIPAVLLNVLEAVIAIGPDYRCPSCAAYSAPDDSIAGTVACRQHIEVWMWVTLNEIWRTTHINHQQHDDNAPLPLPLVTARLLTVTRIALIS